ncbi:hypothetical protein BMW23_0828 [Bodo saltans virus]|uniref:Ankyrin repeat domain-containing protein n=1 Tax=Bodo saltans virus TaxID=2024608 RepID=A0A2H4UVH7_9VIRU|nr:hypothetical protein QJ851_gp0811 [Bodo saltans virus]ATZ80874.1 hypothetical protein BMW23_0828 [Bodo saltans virus]
MDEIYNSFFIICKYGNYSEIEKFIIDNNFELDDDYTILLASRNDINLLKLIKKYNGNLHCYDECIANIFAINGELECLKYIINDCNDNKWKNILETNAYINCNKTKEFIDNKLILA